MGAPEAPPPSAAPALGSLAAHAVEFTDPQITEGIERAHKKCEGMQTPWFIASYVQDEVGDLLMQIVRTEVESALYVNPNFEGAISPFNP